MKKITFLLVLMFFLQVFADNIWINQRPKEFGSASSSIIHVGTKTRGYTMGVADDGQGGKAPYCFVMVDGMFWNNCSPNFTGQMKFVTPARILPDGRLVGVIMEVQGFSVLSSFIVSDDLFNFMPVYFFDVKNRDDQPSTYGRALSVVDNVVWLGLKNGKVKKSTDLGTTWENIVVTSDSEVEITVVKFRDSLNGIAAGGVVKEEIAAGGEQEKVVKEKGCIFQTADGGSTWTPIVEGLKMIPENVIVTSSGRIFLQYYDDKSIKSTSGQKSFVWSDDDFASFSGWDKSFEIQTASGTFSTGTIYDSDEGAVDEIWATGFCGSGVNYNPCTINTFDGGESWRDLIVFGAGLLGPISVLDSNHVYIAGGGRSIWKWGDPNEDFTEQEIPDETVVEIPDETVETPDENKQEEGGQDEDNDDKDREETADDEIDEDEDDGGCSCSFVR
ncbi:MAG: hypothetical protein ACOX2F_07010 [bacterium]